MKCTINIDGRSIPLDWRGGTAIQYKYAFKRDPIADIMSLMSIANLETGEINAEDLGGFDSEIIYRMFWTAARTADKSVNEDFFDFLDEFDSLPFVDILDQGMLEMIVASMISTKQIKNRQAPTVTSQ